MTQELTPGFSFEFQYTVPDDKTVPNLFPEFPEGRVMPKVLATGFMVGLFEFACIKAINPFIRWPEEQTVGIHVNVSHTAATPPGMTVTVKGTLTGVKGKKLSFSLEAWDEKDRISQGTHDRYIVDAGTFNAAVETKRTGG
jgi:fluoroacetyl-CoA thioesterase